MMNDEIKRETYPVQKRCEWCMHLPLLIDEVPCIDCKLVGRKQEHSNFKMPPIPFEELE